MTIDNFLEFIRDETGRTPHTEWAICSRCRGNGTSTAYLGDVTEWLREDPDAAEDYFGGMYDKPCDECSGTGKVRTLPAESPVAHEWAEWQRDEAEDRATRRAESGYAW